MDVERQLTYREFSCEVDGLPQVVELPFPSHLELEASHEGIFHLSGPGKDVWLNMRPDRRAGPDVRAELSEDGRVNYRLPFIESDGASLQSLMPAYLALVFRFDATEWNSEDEWHIFRVGAWSLNSGASKGDSVESMFFTPPGRPMFTLNILTACRSKKRNAYVCMLSSSTQNDTHGDWRWFEKMRQPLVAGAPMPGVVLGLLSPITRSKGSPHGPSSGPAQENNGASGVDTSVAQLEEVGMPQLTEQHFLAALRTGTREERVEILKSLPPNSFKDATIALLGSDNPGMTVVAFSPLIQQYCYGSDPEIGALMAAATHDRALEIWETVPRHGLILTTLSGLASSHVKALTLLGRSEAVLKATDRYIELYEKLNENQNLPSLRVLQIEALINLKRIDDAALALQDKSIFDDPIASIEARRLKQRVDTYQTNVTDLSPPEVPTPSAPTAESLLEVLRKAIDLGFEGETGTTLKAQVNRLDTSKRIDVTDPAQYRQLLDALSQTEELLTRGGAASELTVRQKIRNASAIFVHGTPEPAAIEGSLGELESGLQWARENRSTELENDALWGIYLCRSRLKRPSEAADTLIELRRNLESMRSGIKDPLKRGGIFSTYPHLFNALCEQLHRANRADDLLEAIEASKGRAIADRLTTHGGSVVGDSAIYGCVERVPGLVRREGFHYLTYFVDEECAYAVMVTKQGKIHAIEPVRIRKQELRDAAEAVAPENWGQPQSWAPGTLTEDVSARLAPLVTWLDGFTAQGIVEKGDHICYSSDDDFHNIPLQYLRFRDGILLDWCSVSRVHSAFHLDRVFRGEAQGAPHRYIGFVVPALQDVEKKIAREMLENLEAPVQWLQNHGGTGVAVRLEEATFERIKEEALDHRIVHFSTHGWFPKKGNPYYDSYLLLAGANGLPDWERAAQGDREGKLTPRAILESDLDLEGSHVSMMACVSGLAKEGIAGDTLGLDWALIQAGASSLISTHWEVSAACAAQFFRLFYEKWIDEGKSRASACREAVLELLNGDYKRESLHRWIGFSLTGDFR